MGFRLRGLGSQVLFKAWGMQALEVLEHFGWILRRAQVILGASFAATRPQARKTNPKL